MLQKIETLLINKYNTATCTPNPSKILQNKDTADGDLVSLESMNHERLRCYFKSTKMLLGLLLYDKSGNSLKSGAKANSNTLLFNDYKKYIVKSSRWH